MADQILWEDFRLTATNKSYALLTLCEDNHLIPTQRGNDMERVFMSWCHVFTLLIASIIYILLCIKIHFPVTYTKWMIYVFPIDCFCCYFLYVNIYLET